MALEPITRQEQIIAGKDLEPITRMEKFLKEYGGGGGGGASHWNELEGKPFVTVGGDTLEWDGNTEGLVCVGGVLYKVSDAVPTAEDVANGAVLKYPEGSMDITFTDTGIGILVESNAAPFVIVSESGVGVELDGLIFPEAGTYQNVTFAGCSLTIPGYTGFAIEKLDPKYLPEHSHSWNELADKPFGEVAGDTVEYDGNPNDKYYVILGDATFVKVSDAIPTISDLANGVILVAGEDSLTIQADQITEMNGIIMFSDNMYGVVVPTAGVTFAGATFGEAGTYLMHMGAAETLTITGYAGFVTTKKIDADYLPGIVVLYYDADNYLYANSDTSNTSARLKLAELSTMLHSGMPIYVTQHGTDFNFAYRVTLTTYGNLFYMNASGNPVILYTAECTAT